MTSIVIGGTVVIKSFRCADTEALFNHRSFPRFQGFERIAPKRLLVLDAAQQLGDLAAVPGNRLEQLRGDRQGQYSIRINGTPAH